MRYDEIRYLRIEIKADEQQLANAPLGPRQKADLKKLLKNCCQVNRTS